MSGSIQAIEDEQVNFADGNIIILAGPGAKIPGQQQQDGDVYSFKCHKGVLASRSEVFRQMFETPGSVEDEMINGVQTVTLSDNWEDLRDLLRLLYGYL